MNSLTNLKSIPAVGLLLLGLLATACGAEPGVRQNNEGNKAYAQNAYLEAINLYQNAQIVNPELAEPYYNAANAFYREGQYDQALAQMQQALLHADADLTQHSYFNLGNSFFQSQDLETAVQSYIEALLLNPDDADAKYNLELALNQQQQEQQEQQEQQNQSGSEDEEDNQNQQDQSAENENGAQDQEQEGNQSTENQQSEPGQEGEPENQEQNGQQDGQDTEEGPEESDQFEPGQVGEEQAPQNQEQTGQSGETGEQETGLSGLQPGEKLSKEQAEQLLAVIANNSQTLQEKLGQILVVPGPPPAQDW